jgi:hypothetical protein
LAGTGEAERFTCHTSTTENSDLSSDRAQFCNSGVYGRNTDVPAVEYFVPKEAMPTGKSIYVNSNGFNNHFMQTLKEAERKWSDNGRLINSNSELENQISDSIQTEGDYSYPNDVLDSWVAANGSDHHSKIGDTSFKGGFAPKCEEGQEWEQTEDGWQCSGEITWSHEVWMPDVSADSEGETDLGFYIMPYVFHQGSTGIPTKESYYEFVDNQLARSPAMISVVSAKCWRGEPSDESSIEFNEDNYNESWFSVNVSVKEGPSVPVPVFGELDMTGYSEHSCSWGFHDKNGYFVDDLGGVDKLSAREVRQKMTEREDNIPLPVTFDLPSGMARPDISDRMTSQRIREMGREWTAAANNIERNKGYAPEIAKAIS